MPHDLYVDTTPFIGDDNAADATASPSAPQVPPPAAALGASDSASAAAPQAHAKVGHRPPRSQDRSPGDTGLPQPGDRVDHYELIRELGRGGMGVVYLARDLKLGRRVAVKFIHARHGEHARRFIAEARTTARCQHEHIVIIHDIGQRAGNPYMVLEYLPGRTLCQSHTGKAQLPERCLELMIPVVRALERAHAHGIVHRDLKPSNILVSDTGLVKVLDFGIAKVFATETAEHSGPLAVTYLSSDLASDLANDLAGDQLGHRATAARDGACEPAYTKAGSLLGTLPYMSPEQLGDSANVDARTDIWAVGIILYELLLGHHPLAPLHAGQLESIADVDIPMPLVAEKVPHAGKLATIIDRCLTKDRHRRLASASELLAELEALAAHGGSTRTGPESNPFTGLAAFQAADADRFYGRSRDIANVLTHVRNRPLVTVVGPSGAGKSSLVRAGVIPALENAGEGWQTRVVRPGRDPLAALAAVLDDVHTQSGINSQSKPSQPTGPQTRPWDVQTPDVHTPMARLRHEPGLFGSQLRAWARRHGRRLLLFVDQFEELYTLVRDGEDLATFLQCLGGAADDASSPLRVVVSIRSDFLDRLMEAGDFMTDLSRSLVFLAPMDRDGMRQALTKPIETAGYSFEDQDLVDDMLKALSAGGTAGMLPLMQFAASKLWDSRDQERHLLTRTGYESFGGVAGALAAHGDAVLAGLTSDKLDITRAIFERLVTPERTRAVVTMAELRQLPGDTATIDQVIHDLANARLLVIESHGPSQGQSPAAGKHKRRPPSAAGTGDSTVEIVHESLINSWPLLRRWLEDGREDAVFLDRLRTAARQWDAGDRREGLLWRGEAADEAAIWQARYRGQLPARDRAFLDAVLGVIRRAKRKRRLAIGGGFAVMMTLLMAAVGGLIVINASERKTAIQAKLAQQRASELASAKTSLEQSLTQQRLAQTQTEAARDSARAAQTRAEDALTQSQAASERERLARQQAETAAKARGSALAELRDTLAQLQKAEAEARASQAAAEKTAARERALKEEYEAIIRRALGTDLDSEMNGTRVRLKALP